MIVRLADMRPLVNCLLNNLRSTSLWSQFRCMSMFPKHYVEPVVTKEEQDLLKSDNALGQYTHVPTKPAKNDESTSIFYHKTVNKMTNYITKNGNKKLARDLLEKTFANIKRIQIQRSHLGKDDNIIIDPYKLLLQSIENCRPLLRLTPIKRGGVTYQVPVPVTEKASYFLAMKWLIEAAKDKDRKIHLPEKLAWEILDASNNQGRVIKRKNDLHKQCETNRAYAHYRWS